MKSSTRFVRIFLLILALGLIVAMMFASGGAVAQDTEPTSTPVGGGGQDPLELTTPIPGGQGQDPLDSSPSDGGASSGSGSDDSGGSLCFSPVLAPLAFVAFGLVIIGRPFSRRRRR